MTLDPACEFLLHTPYENLFEALGPERDATRHRCKGCRLVLPRWERLTHWQNHQKQAEKREIQRKIQTAEAHRQALIKARAARKAKREAA